jgi:uncharacterized protein (DUF1778 family)
VDKHAHKRRNRVLVLLSDSERALIEQAAEADRRQLGPYIRHIVLQAAEDAVGSEQPTDD